MRITYQGKLCNRGSYTRKPGLTADTGWVELNIEAFGEVVLAAFARTFRHAFGVIGQPFNPRHIPRIVDTVLRARPQEQPSGEFQGLKIVGQLVFDSTDRIESGGDPGRRKDQLVVLDGIYVQPDAMMEILEDLQEQNHREGEVRLQLTDIRQFWTRHGGLGSHMNIRMEAGNFDLRTVDLLGSPGGPYTLRGVIQYCLSHLPGSLKIGPGSTIRIDTVTPENIYGNWRRPIEVLAELLEKHRLNLTLNPDETVTIFELGASHRESHFRIDGDETPLPKEHLNYKKKGMRFNPRPEVVTVVGEPIYQNVQRRCVPVMMDEDGKIKPLEEVLKNMKLDKAKVLAGMQIEHQWKLPLEGIPGKNEAQKKLRKKLIDTCAWRWWAISSAAWVDGAEMHNPDLPIRDRVVRTLTKSAASAVDSLAGELGLSPIDNERASDKGEDLVSFEPPRVLANYLTQMMNFDRGLLIEALFDELTTLKKLRAEEDKEIEKIERQFRLPAINHALQLISKSDAAVKGVDILDAFTPDEQQALFGEMNLNEPLSKRKSDFWTVFKKNLPGGFSSGDLVDARGIALRTRLFEKLLEKKKALEDLIEQYERRLKDLDKTIDKIRDDIKKIQNSAIGQETGFVRGMWVTVFGVVPPNKYHIDETKGIIIFDEPVVIMREAARTIKSHLHAEHEGYVKILYGLEHKSNNPQDFVYANFTYDEAAVKKGKDGVKFLGLCNRVFTSPLVVHDRKLVLYLDDRGEPFNDKIVIDQARQHARRILSIPPIQTAWEYSYDGFWPVDSSHDVSAVTWESDGDLPFTRIEVNEYESSRGGPGAGIRNKLATSTAATNRTLYGERVDAQEGAHE